MGLPGFRQYRDAQDGAYTDLRERTVFPLLRTLDVVVSVGGLAWQLVSYRRLELACHDRTDDVLVLVVYALG